MTVSRPVSGILWSPRGDRWPSICAAYPEAAPRRERTGRPCLLLGLAPDGVCRAARVAPDAGALLPHRFTLTCGRSPGPSAVSLCCTDPSGRPDLALASTLPCGVPTFLDVTSTPRPPGRLTVADQSTAGVDLRGARRQASPAGHALVDVASCRRASRGRSRTACRPRSARRPRAGSARAMPNAVGIGVERREHARRSASTLLAEQRRVDVALRRAGRRGSPPRPRGGPPGRRAPSPRRAAPGR